MISQMLYGRYAYNPKNDDRCPWGLIWDVDGDTVSVRCCQKKRGHDGPHRAVFEEEHQYVRIEWAHGSKRAWDYFEEVDKAEGEAKE